MKKLFLTIILAVFAAGAAHAQFFYGLQFGIYSDTSAAQLNEQGSELVPGGSSFNYTVKPSVGYYFSPRLAAGVKFAYTNCARNRAESGQMVSSINSIALNILLGNGLDTDYQSWKISPYVRYQLFSLLSDKLNIWAEIDGYYGSKTFRQADGTLNPKSRKSIHGVELHPLVSYDITPNFMVYTSLDILSFNWEGTSQNKSVGLFSDETQTVHENTFVLQSVPLMAVAKGILNIGIIRRF